MFQHFKDALKKFIENRVDEIGNKLVIKNAKYKELAEASIKIHYQIKDKLPDHSKQLIDEYETINTSMQCISEEIMYEQGLIDGIRTNGIIKSLKLHFYKFS